MRAKTEEKKRAIELRCSGQSIKEIAKELGVSVGSVSLWVRNAKISKDGQTRLLAKTPNRKNAGRAWSEKWKSIRRTQQERGRAEARKYLWLHAAGCMLYWGEGRKSKNQVRLTNGDPNLIRFFTIFLTQSCEVAPEDIALVIKYHKGGLSEDQITNYWIKTTQLPKTCVRSVSIISDQRCKVHNNKLPYGLCEILVYKTELVQHIYGAIKEYAGIDDENLWIS